MTCRWCGRVRRRRAGLPGGSGRVHAVTGAEALEPDPAVPAGSDRPASRPGPGAGGGARRGRAGPDAGRPGAGVAARASRPSRPRGGPGSPAPRSRACSSRRRRLPRARRRRRARPGPRPGRRAGRGDGAAGGRPGRPGRGRLPAAPDGLGGARRRRPSDASLAEDAARGRPSGGPAGRAAAGASSRPLTEEPQGDPRAGTASRSPTLKAENADLRHKLGDARARARSAEDAAADAVAGGGRGGARRRGRRRRPGTRPRCVGCGPAWRSSSATWPPYVAPSAPSAGRRRCARGCCSTRCSTPRRGCAASWRCRRSRGRPPTPSRRTSPSTAAARPPGTARWPSDDPALLEQLLALPRVHLVVDGYNVTKTAWPELSLERQRDRLLAGLAPLVARSGAEVTVVFDAADSTRPAAGQPAPRGAGALQPGRGDRRRRDPRARRGRAAGPSGRRGLQRPGRGPRRGAGRGAGRRGAGALDPAAGPRSERRRGNCRRPLQRFVPARDRTCTDFPGRTR